MSEEQLRQSVRQSFDAMQPATVPDFDKTITAAEQRLQRSRRRKLAWSGIAAAVAIVAIASIRPDQSSNEYLDAEALLATTYWAAPSDVLLPQPELDIYRDLPVLIESSEFNEGALL